MIHSIQALVPSEWQGAVDVLSAPVSWIPAWHAMMVNLVWYGDTTLGVLFKRIVLMLPVMLLLSGMWITMISLYTIPFRSNRGRFVVAMLTSWWDAGRSAWFFWAGLVRLVVLLAGWTWGLLRLALGMAGALLKGTFQSPLRLLDWTSRNYFKPGVPWLAFLALILWSAVEALVFMYTLRPTLTEVLAGITGYEPSVMVLGPILWLFLFFLVLGSFACVFALAEALRKKDIVQILQMTFVELFVMFFEVIFLYRELIDAITPWIAQQTNEGVQLGLISTLLLASFGWVGVRGMTWFLFGRYGTPALVAVLARDTIRQEVAAPATEMVAQPDLLRTPIMKLKQEAEWFKKEAQYAFELLSLPVLQLFAAAVNFAVVVIGSRPMFSLPFRSIEDVLVATHRLGGNKVAAPPPGRARSTAPVQDGGAV
ncbi:MAG: hypothetical protein JSW71_00770 [Gemmatimonadota bacterium]|nr:MAG: hypothetical protein JSW71_00770 [Gemmatimonadota bacterium]